MRKNTLKFSNLYLLCHSCSVFDIFFIIQSIIKVNMWVSFYALNAALIFVLVGMRATIGRLTWNNLLAYNTWFTVTKTKWILLLEEIWCEISLLFSSVLGSFDNINQVPINVLVWKIKLRPSDVIYEVIFLESVATLYSLPNCEIF